MGISDTLFDEMTAIRDASIIIAQACLKITNREGLALMTRIHFRLRKHHQELMYLHSFEREIAIERIKMEYE